MKADWTARIFILLAWYLFACLVALVGYGFYRYGWPLLFAVPVVLGIGIPMAKNTLPDWKRFGSSD